MLKRSFALFFVFLGLGSCLWGMASLAGGFNRLLAGLSMLPYVPGLLGFEEGRTYLLLAQNRDELRATGGFITGIGTLRLERGRLLEWQIGDSYRVDDYSKNYPKPPEPLQIYMKADYWVPRDANWYPDFRISAQQVQALYTLSTGQSVQGVIAFDQAALRALVARLGALQVEGFPEPVTEENVEALMQQAWEPAEGQRLDQTWWQNRKSFMSVLGKALMERLKALRDPFLLLGLAQDGLGLLESGHVLVYFFEPGLQAALHLAGLDGSLDAGEGDFLLWVDSNVGFNKTDAVITRELVYQVDLSHLDQPTAKLQASFQHNGQGKSFCKHEASYGTGDYADMRARCYWDYWRAYLAPGVRLLNAQVKPVAGENLVSGRAWDGQVECVSDESGLAVCAGLLLLPTGERQAVRLDTALPKTALQPLPGGWFNSRSGWRYTLRVQKQAGLSALPLRLSVMAPVGYHFSGGSGWQQVGENQWVWRGVMDKTRVFVVEIWHE